MRVVLQRCTYGEVIVNNKSVGKIDKGFVILVGFTNDDNIDKIKSSINKIIKLRVFDDDNGAMNLNINDINGSILSISQFTLYADTAKGNRPSYNNAMKKEDAIKLYDEFNNELRKYIHVETGIFNSDMKVIIHNDGPVTITMEW